MQNLILTDIMKTGHHYFYGHYINFADIPGQKIDVVNDYYLLPTDLSKYSRKIALICSMNSNYVQSNEYVQDLNRRIARLKQLGFQFIMASPWESRANVDGNQIIKNYTKETILTWYGEHDWFWYFMWYRHHQKTFNIDHSNKKYDFLYLNKLGREHRKQLYRKMQSTLILNNSLYSYLDQRNPKRLPKQYEAPWVHNGIYQMENLNGQDQDIFEPPYNDTTCSLITESNVISTDEIFITEKIWKAVIMKHVFIVYGNYKTLDCMKQQGFKTFNDIFDESYDQEADHQKRKEKIVDLCFKIKAMDPKTLYQQTQDIREHNYKTFFNRMNIVRNCTNTVSLWFTKHDQAVRQ